MSDSFGGSNSPRLGGARLLHVLRRLSGCRGEQRPSASRPAVAATRNATHLRLGSATTSSGCSPLPPIMTSGSDKHDRPGLRLRCQRGRQKRKSLSYVGQVGNLLGPTSNSGGRCFVSPDMSGDVREPRPTKSEGRSRFSAPKPSCGSDQYTGQKDQNTTEDDLEYGG